MELFKGIGSDYHLSMLKNLLIATCSFHLFAMIGVLQPDFGESDALNVQYNSELTCAYDLNLRAVENQDQCDIEKTQLGLDSFAFKVFKKEKEKYFLKTISGKELAVSLNGIYQSYADMLASISSLKLTDQFPGYLYENPSLLAKKNIFPNDNSLNPIKFVKLPRKEKGQPVSLAPLYLNSNNGLSIFSVSFSNVGSWIFSITDDPEKKVFEQEQIIPVFAEENEYYKVLFEKFGFMKMRSPSIFSRLKYNSWGLPEIWVKSKDTIEITSLPVNFNNRLMTELTQLKKIYQVPSHQLKVLDRKQVDNDLWIQVEIDPRNICHSTFGTAITIKGWLPLKKSATEYYFRPNSDEPVCTSEV